MQEMKVVDEDHNVLFSNWGSWKFTKEGELKLKELFQLGSDIDQTTEPSNEWKFLLSKMPTTNSESEKDFKDDFLDDVRVSEDDSDTGWDDIELFTSKIRKPEQSLENVDFEKTVDMISALVVHDEKIQSDSVMEVDCNEIDINLSKSQNTFPRKIEQNVIRNSEILSGNVEDNVRFRKDRHELGRNDERTDLPQLLLAKLNADVIDKDGVNELVETRTITKEQLSNVWKHLESREAKIALSRSLANVALYNVFLCQTLLLPWLSSSDFENEKEIVDNIAEILPQVAEVSVKELLLPLISNQNGVFVKNLNLLPDIMCRVDTNLWGALLRNFINSTNVSLEKWQLPVVIRLLEQITDDSIDAESINRLINLLSSSVDEFVKDKDFGNLLIAVATLIHKSETMSESVESLKGVAERYKGIMRFKVMSIIKSSPYYE